MKKNLLLTALLLGSAAFFAQAQTGNVGVGTNTPGSKLTINGSFAADQKSISGATYTVGANDFALTWSHTADGTFNLPAAVSGSGNFKGRVYIIKNNTTDKYLTVDANGTEQLTGGSLIRFINPGCEQTFISTGATSGVTWEIISSSCDNGDPYTPLFAGLLGADFAPSTSSNPIPITGIIELSDANNVFDGSSVYTCKRTGTYEVSITFTHVSSNTSFGRVVAGLISVTGGDAKPGGGTTTAGQWLARGNFQETPTASERRTVTFVTTVTMILGNQYSFGVARATPGADAVNPSNITLFHLTTGTTGSGYGSYFSIKRIDN